MAGVKLRRDKSWRKDKEERRKIKKKDKEESEISLKIPINRKD